LYNTGFFFYSTGLLLLTLIILGLFFSKRFKNLIWIGLCIFLAVGSGVARVSNYVFNNILKPHQQERINVWLRPELSDPKGSLYNVIQSKIAIGSGGLQGKGFNEVTLTILNYVP